MNYLVIADSENQIAFATHPRERRGRGVLFSLAPIVCYALMVTVLFAAASREIRWWSLAVRVSEWSLVGVAVLAALAFAAGRRMRTTIKVTPQTVEICKVSPSGHLSLQTLECSALTALEIELSLRSLGADRVLVAVDRAGCRIPVAEGDPHSGQLVELGHKIAKITALPLHIHPSTNVSDRSR